MEQRFRSKIDWWLALLVFGPIGVMLLRVIGAVAAGAPWWTLAIPTAVAAFLLWLFSTTDYTVTDELLIVRSGPFRSRVPIRSIRKLRSTWNPISSPALSLDRIEVIADKGPWLLVSPADTRGFVEAIRQRKPDVAIEGKRLIQAVGPVPPALSSR